jgi:DNA-binding NarL/FixJ family response regulator
MTIRVVLGEDIDLAREAILHVLEEEDIDVDATCRDSSTHSHRGSGRSLRSKRAVERHIKSIFSKLGLADAGTTAGA